MGLELRHQVVAGLGLIWGSRQLCKGFKLRRSKNTEIKKFSWGSKKAISELAEQQRTGEEGIKLIRAPLTLQYAM